MCVCLTHSRSHIQTPTEWRPPLRGHHRGSGVVWGTGRSITALTRTTSRACCTFSTFTFWLWVRASSLCNVQMPKPGGSSAAPPGGRDGTGRSSISSGSGGKILSLLSMSESMHSGFSFLSEQAQEQEERQQRSSQLAELQRLREVRAAAQLKNLEDFLRINHVSLRDTTAFSTGMIYRCKHDPRQEVRSSGLLL